MQALSKKLASVYAVLLFVSALVAIISLPGSAASSGVTSVAWGYGPKTTFTPGYVQWQAFVWVNSTTNPVGIPVNWYLDGVLAYTGQTGPSGGPTNEGTAYFGVNLAAGSHTIYFTAGGVSSSTLNPCSGSCTTTTTTSTTTSSTSSTSTVTWKVYYSGAVTTDSSLYSNSGIRATIDIHPQPNNARGDYLFVWASDYLPNNLWIQVGYVVWANKTFPFYNVWRLPNTMLVDTWGTQALTTGAHEFQAVAINSTAWGFYVDGVSLGVYNAGSSVSISTPSEFLIEEQGQMTAPYPTTPILFQSIEYFKGGTWNHVVSGSVWSGSVSNVQGRIQLPGQLANGEILVGGTGSTTGPLWNGTG